MHVHVRNLTTVSLLVFTFLSFRAGADDFSEISGYDEVTIEADESLDQTVINDISDAVGSDQSEEPGFANSTPEPEYDPGMSEMANKIGKKKAVKKSGKKKSKKLAKNLKSKNKKSKAKKRTLAKN